MTAVANVRVNVPAPFPALVTGSGPITLGKINGVWQIGLSVDGLALQGPVTSNFNSDFLLIWDSVAKQFAKVPLSIALAGARHQKAVIASPIVIDPGDHIINCNIPTAATCALPQSAFRDGVPLTFKDIGGQAGAHNITLTANGAEKIDGLSTFVLNANFQGVTLVPFNDGVNTGSGWMVQ